MPNGMDDTRAFLRSMGLPAGDAHDLPSSDRRFPDGGQWRIEIPSVEGQMHFRRSTTPPTHSMSRSTGSARAAASCC